MAGRGRAGGRQGRQWRPRKDKRSGFTGRGQPSGNVLTSRGQVQSLRHRHRAAPPSTSPGGSPAAARLTAAALRRRPASCCSARHTTTRQRCCGRPAAAGAAKAAWRRLQVVFMAAAFCSGRRCDACEIRVRMEHRNPCRTGEHCRVAQTGARLSRGDSAPHLHPNHCSIQSDGAGRERGEARSECGRRVALDGSR